MKNTTIIYGKNPVLSILENSPERIIELYVTPQNIERISKQGSKFKLTVCSKHEIDRLTDPKAAHQGFAAKITSKQFLNIKDIESKLENKERITIVALDHITDVGNFGAIARSAAAFGVDALIFTKDNSAARNPQVHKTSAGTIEYIDMVEVTNLTQTLKQLKERGFWIFGLDANSNAELETIKEYNKKVIVLGAEGEGIRKLVKEECDFLVKINMKSEVESLNVSNAAAIALYVTSLK